MAAMLQLGCRCCFRQHLQSTKAKLLHMLVLSHVHFEVRMHICDQQILQYHGPGCSAAFRCPGMATASAETAAAAAARESMRRESWLVVSPAGDAEYLRFLLLRASDWSGDTFLEPSLLLRVCLKGCLLSESRPLSAPAPLLTCAEAAHKQVYHC